MRIVSKIQSTGNKLYILPFVRLERIVNEAFCIYALQIGWFLWYWDLYAYKINSKEEVV